MRKRFSHSLLAGAVVSAIALASPPPKHDAVAYAPPATAPATVTSFASVQGTVRHFLLSPLGRIEGLLLSGNVQVQFPAHVGERLAALVERGDAVEVAGRRSDGNASIEAYAIKTADGHEVLRRPPLFRHVEVQAGVVPLNSLEAAGTIELVLRSADGAISGVLLSDGTVVHLPAYLTRLVAPELVAGMNLSVSGFGLQNQHGRVIEATAIAAY